MQFSEYVLGEIEESLDKDLKAVFDDTLGKKETLKKYINSILYNNFIKASINDLSVVENYLDQSTIKEIVRYHDKQRKGTKKRWYNKLIKDLSSSNPNPLLEELTLAENYINMYGEKQFKEVYKLSSIEELKETRLKTIQEWVDNADKDISSYIYFKANKSITLQKNLNIDFIYHIAKIILNKWDGDMQNIQYLIPDIMYEYPVISDGRGKIKASKDTIVQGKIEYLYNDYTTEKGTTRILVNKSKDDSSMDLSAIDPTDQLLVSVILTHRNIDFLNKKFITLNVYTLVSEVYKSRSISNLESIKNRITKLTNMRVNFFRKGNETNIPDVVYGIFSGYEYLNEEQTEIKILLDENLYKKIIENQVKRTFKKRIQNLEIPLSQVLVYLLQDERIQWHIKGKQKTVLDYSFFKNRVRFRYRMVSKNMKIIAEALLEMKNNGIIVKNFEEYSSGFMIDFYPVTENEMKDILTYQNDNNILLL